MTILPADSAFKPFSPDTGCEFEDPLFRGRCDSGGAAICEFACRTVSGTPVVVDRVAPVNNAPSRDTAAVTQEGPLSFIVGGY